MNAADHRAQFYADHLRTLNRLVFAAEALDGPSPFERPASLAWDSHPTDDQPETLEAALAVLEEWRAYASRLDDCLSGVEYSEANDEIGGVRAKAKEARLALIALEVYEPPSVVGG